MSKVSLYHGSGEVVAHPSLAKGRAHNDYGRGFYTTREHELACEWACKRGDDGYVNEYSLWSEGLVVLDLLDGSHSTLEWVALLLANRHFDLRLPTAAYAREQIVKGFCPDLSSVDVVVGYRADDSYFSYARAFVENALPLGSLEEALRLGGLGEQVVLVSGRAFSRLTYEGSERVRSVEYHPRFLAREERAREGYLDLVRRQKPQLNQLFVLDILREEMTLDEPRIRRYLSVRR